MKLDKKFLTKLGMLLLLVIVVVIYIVYNKKSVVNEGFLSTDMNTIGSGTTKDSIVSVIVPLENGTGIPPDVVDIIGNQRKLTYGEKHGYNNSQNINSINTSFKSGPTIGNPITKLNIIPTETNITKILKVTTKSDSPSASPVSTYYTITLSYSGIPAIAAALTQNNKTQLDSIDGTNNKRSFISDNNILVKYSSDAAHLLIFTKSGATAAATPVLLTPVILTPKPSFSPTYLHVHKVSAKIYLVTLFKSGTNKLYQCLLNYDVSSNKFSVNPSYTPAMSTKEKTPETIYDIHVTKTKNYQFKYYFLTKP